MNLGGLLSLKVFKGIFRQASMRNGFEKGYRIVDSEFVKVYFLGCNF